MPKKSDDQVMDDYGRTPAPYAPPPATVVLPQGFAHGLQPYAAPGQRVMYPASGPVLGDAGVDNRLGAIADSMGAHSQLDPAVVAHLQGRPAPRQEQERLASSDYIDTLMKMAGKKKSGLPTD